MSSADARMWADMVQRVNKLEELTERLAARVTGLGERIEGKDLSAELYGAEADHSQDRAERAEIMRRGPGRPPGPRTT